MVRPRLRTQKTLTRMKTLRKLWLAALAACTFAACSDSEPAALQPQLPATGGSNVKSITHLGGVESTYDWEFIYNGKRLTDARGTVRDASDQVDQKFQYTSKIGYGPNSVTLASSSGEKIELVLNGQGYVGQMRVNRNVYNFIYGIDGRLTAWDKTVFEESLGQIQQYRSSASITYTNGTYDRIIYTGTDNRVTTLTFQPSQLVNLNGLLPVGVSKELGCIGFEQLYYAGLLGRPSANLIASVSYDFENDANNYTTSFSYNNRAGNTVLCNYVTPSGAVASVSYGY